MQEKKIILKENTYIQGKNIFTEDVSIASNDIELFAQHYDQLNTEQEQPNK